MKFFRAAAVLFVCISLLPAFPAHSQTLRSLIGKVQSDHAPDMVDWSVQVAAERQGGGDLPNSRFSSIDDLYYYRVDSNIVLSFIFSRTYYRSKRSPWVNVTNELSDPVKVVPDVTLNRIKKRRRRSASIHPTGGSTRSPYQTVSYNGRQIEQDTQRQEILELRRELEEQALLARISNTADIFQFNLEVYQDIYRDETDSALKAEVAQFKTASEYRDVASAPPERADLYRKMIQRDRGEPVLIESDKLIGIANDVALSPSIRQSAVRAMTVDAVPISNLRLMNFLRDNAYNPTSKLRLASLTQLIKLGEPADHAKILKELENSDIQATHPVIQAIESTRWTLGRNALASLMKRENTLPAMREVAQEAVARFDSPWLQRGSLGFNPEAIFDAFNSAKRRTSSDRKEFFRSTGELFGKPISQKLALPEELKGAQADLDVKQRPDGTTQLKVRFRDLKGVEGANNYVLWAISPESYVIRLGQVVNTGNRRESQIEAEVSLKNFGLFITAEKTDMVAQPTGPVVAVAPKAPPSRP